MNNQYLIIYQFTSLYEILKELEFDLNFKIIQALNDKSLNDAIKSQKKKYLIITKKKLSSFNNQYVPNVLPIKLTKLMENFNIEFLKQQFNHQSEINIGDYKININSREIVSKNQLKLKLTEKETNIILYLSNTGGTVRINELQKNVWGYQSDLETHTVETHIYRLRKKFLKIFDDKNFILSKKNGYEI
jgi:DNA-binding response OmpR family regulator